MIEPRSRLRVARGLAKSERQASVKAFETLRGRGNPKTPPVLTSDGHGGIREALVEVYGQLPKRRPGPGRPPKLKQAAADWLYLQLVKKRSPTGRLLSIERRMIYGTEAELLTRMGGHTSYVERTHLTSRHRNSRLVRKSLGYSKTVRMLSASSKFEDAIYNWCRPVKTLRQRIESPTPASTKPFQRRWRERSPAMAAGLTGHIWTLRELLYFVVVPTVKS